MRILLLSAAIVAALSLTACDNISSGPVDDNVVVVDNGSAEMNNAMDVDEPDVVITAPAVSKPVRTQPK